MKHKIIISYLGWVHNSRLSDKMSQSSWLDFKTLGIGTVWLFCEYKIKSDEKRRHKKLLFFTFLSRYLTRGGPHPHSLGFDVSGGDGASSHLLLRRYDRPGLMSRPKRGDPLKRIRCPVPTLCTLPSLSPLASRGGRLSKRSLECSFEDEATRRRLFFDAFIREATGRVKIRKH